jgi:glycerol-3-phosphate acyltransferase PlsY
MFATLLVLFCLIVAYLVGSVCSAVIVCRLFDLPDPRVEGSQNPGATNVLRIAGKQYAAIVLLADMLKGFLPVLLANLLGAGPTLMGFTCFAAVIGHMYPVFFGFKGGKGVATAIGAMLGFHLFLGVMVIATWLLIANFTRLASLASILSMTLAPFYSLFIVRSSVAFPPLIFITIFIIYQHRNNLTRLMDGNEPKITLSPKTHNKKTTKKQPPVKNSLKVKPSGTVSKAMPKSEKAPASKEKQKSKTAPASKPKPKNKAVPTSKAVPKNKAAPKKKPAKAKKTTP